MPNKDTVTDNPQYRILSIVQFHVHRRTSSLMQFQQMFFEQHPTLGN
jgi:hypothetical protein